MRSLAALIALTIPIVAHAEFVSGTELLRRMEARDRIERGAAQTTDYQDSSFVHGFLAGVHDVLVDVTFCSPSNVTLGQVRRIAQSYIRAIPHRHHENAYQLVREALDGAFPCAERRQQPQRSL